MPRPKTAPKLLAAAALGALALAQPAAAQQKVLRVVPSANLTLLDPVATSTVIIREHGLAIYESLFAWDADFNPKPMMVETYAVSPDKLKYTFTLRPGLKFHDGSPVATKDVLASLNRWMARDLMGQKLKQFMTGIERVDDRSFTLTLKEPYGFVELSLGSAIGQIPVIMREKEAMTDPFQQVPESIGSGPYKFIKSEWVPGATVVYEKNTDYVPRSEPPNGLSGARLVKVDRMEWKVIPDAATAANALARGEVDLWDQPRIDLLPTLATNKEVVIGKLHKLGNVGLYRPNALFPPFNNVKARQALAALINQPDYMGAAFGDPKFWQTCDAYYVCGGPYETKTGSEMFGKRPDRDKAKQLLAESGYKGEPIVILSTTEIGWIGALAEVAASELKAIGANVDLQIYDWGATTARVNKKDPPDKGGWNIFLTGASGATMHHPLTNLGTNMSCKGDNFIGWPCDEETESLRDKFIRAPDEATRKTTLEALSRRLWEEQPYTLLGQYDQPYAWRRNIEGVLKAPIIVFWNISKS
ncbi:MAG: ABC transporter substrate-binding protein [Proteobacteria bacterium]|nr:ABC transporter substrate-binding protein [Pseudomonadota bacterium]